MKEAPKIVRTAIGRAWLGLLGILAIVFVFAIAISLFATPPSSVPGSSSASASVSPSVALTEGIAPSESRKDAGISDADPAIKSVSNVSSQLLIKADLGSAFDDEGMINNAAVIAYDIGRAVKGGAPEASAAKTIKVTYTTDVTDRLGTVSNGTVMVLSFDADDMRNANYANLGAREVMNLAKDKRVFAPAMPGVAKWCQHNADHASDFCSF
jgi:hypothetical protein